MKKVSVFEFRDYKAFMWAQIKERESGWGAISRLAKAAGCQRSYFSRVLNAEVHLTADQAHGLCQYWNLNEKEAEYFLNLLESDRASTKSYRDRLREKIKRMRQEHEDLQARVNRPAAETGQIEIIYYSNWYHSAIHILVSIANYRTPKAIAERLELSEVVVLEALRNLESFGFVKKSGNEWLFADREIHVPKTSPLALLHHSNWRSRAVQDAQRRREESVHFTVVQSMDQRAWDQIKEKVLTLIDEATKIAGPAPPEKLVGMTCDLFEV